MCTGTPKKLPPWAFLFAVCPVPESTVPLLGVCLLVQMCTRNLPYLSTNMSLWITSTTNGNDCIDRIIFSFNNKHAKFTLGPNAEHWDTVVTLKDLRMYLGEAKKKS